MKQTDLTVFAGPNIHSRRPLVRLTLAAGGLEALSGSALHARLTDRLLEGPGWDEVRAALAHSSRETKAVEVQTALGLLAVALQADPFGADLRHWSEPAVEPGSWQVMAETRDTAVAGAAAAFALSVVAHLYAEQNGDGMQGQLVGEMDAFLARREALRFSDSVALIAQAARARGLPVSRLAPDIPIPALGQGIKRQRVMQCASDRTSAFAARLSDTKDVTLRLLRDAGLPVPLQRPGGTIAETRKAVEAIGFPMVVKGRTGSRGHSVTAGIGAPEQVGPAVKKALRHSTGVIFESHVPGDDYRLTCVGGRMVAAARRVAAHVVGDGRLTLRALMEQENAQRLERHRFLSWQVPLAIDADSEAMLARVELTPDSVPDAGQRVRLRSVNNIAQGGLPEDVTDRVHPSVARQAERAAEVVGLDLAGVDVITTDIAKPLSETGGAIIEVNQFPNLSPHYLSPPPHRDVAGAIVAHLFPDGASGRVPIVAVTGIQDDPELCRLLAAVLSQGGATVGLSTGDGLFVGSETIAVGDAAAALGASTILQDPRVEAAVFDLSQDLVLSNGLPWDRCDVCIVTGATEKAADTRALRLLIEQTDRAVVLDADSAERSSVAEHATAPVWQVGTAPTGSTTENAVLIETVDGTASLVHRVKETRTSILPLAALGTEGASPESPAALAAMRAAAAALALGMTAAEVGQALTARAG